MALEATWPLICGTLDTLEPKPACHPSKLRSLPPFLLLSPPVFPELILIPLIHACFFFIVFFPFSGQLLASAHRCDIAAVKGEELYVGGHALG